MLWNQYPLGLVPISKFKKISAESMFTVCIPHRGPENWPPLQRGLGYIRIFCRVVVTGKNSNLFFFFFIVCFFSFLWPLTWFIGLLFSAQSVRAPLTARWQWWIFCVHSKHTKGSDKGRINNKANILTEKRRQQKRNQVEKRHKREEGKKWRITANA